MLVAPGCVGDEHLITLQLDYIATSDSLHRGQMIVGRYDFLASAVDSMTVLDWSRQRGIPI
jgi:hypothetical protein